MTQTAAAIQEVFLKDYTPFGYEIRSVHLTFRLSPGATRVISRIEFAPNPATPSRAFFLHGVDLKLISATVDGAPVAFETTPLGLTATVPDAPFVWEAEVEIAPDQNTALEGLYMSNGMYCTQCEAEGFRKITYYPDRPDVMATFTVRIEGDEPVMLSNGNPTGSGDGWAEWHDPWPKPAYLFALVAGDLIAHPDTFTTMSGNHVDLNIWVRPGDEHKCAFGMQALKKSMIWDEQVYGREYDLDIFNIVAVDDFNMGAMENKGLNIFNSSAVLTSPDTSTDATFERVEAIIAHEYFHNWTGNRITCRDWFQLCLKEGLTVYRDAQFTSDMRGAAVKRIGDVIALRGRQFREDNGPLSHPVRPESFVEINNFYTATVYEKGAEVIGMLHLLVGEENYAKALDVYFDRHDGQACTIEDWLKVFEDVTGRDLTQFKRWYSQAGTPRVAVSEDYVDGTYTLNFTQSTPATPGQPDKDPRVIPIAVGLLGADGSEILATQVLEMTEASQSFEFKDLSEKPIPSILREFSAPVILQRDSSDAERAFLLAHDTDPFNKWEAGRALTKTQLVALINDETPLGADYLDALAQVAQDDGLDPAFRALALGAPSQDDLAQTMVDAGQTPDPTRIYNGLQTWRQQVAERMQNALPALYAAHQVDGPYSPDAEDANKRALQGVVLGFLARLDGGQQAERHFASATNMTEQLTALGVLLANDRGAAAAAAAAAFYDQWKDDKLVLNNWFMIQAVNAAPETAVKTVTDLTKHADFEWKNPNRFRSVIGGLAANAAGFHDASGAGYDLVADWLIKLDGVNPQTTARVSTCFETWRRYDADRQAMMRDALTRIKNAPNLSRDTTEMVTRILGG